MIANSKVVASTGKVLGLPPSAIVHDPTTGLDTGVGSSSDNPGQTMQPIYRVAPTSTATGDSSQTSLQDEVTQLESEVSQLQSQNTQLESELSQFEQNQSNSVNSLSGTGTGTTDSTMLSNELASLGLTNTASMGQSQNILQSLLGGSLGASSLSISSLSGVSSTAPSALTGLDSFLLASAMTGTTSTGSGLPASNDPNIPWSQNDPLVYDTANLGNSSAEGWLAEQASALPSDQAAAVDNLISGAQQTLQTDETAAANNQLSGSNAAALSQQTQNIENVIHAFNAADGNSTTGQLLTASNYPGPSADPFLNGGSSSFLGGGFPISPTPPSPSPIQPFTLGSAGTAAGTQIGSHSSGISGGNSLVAQAVNSGSNVTGSVTSVTAAPLASTSSIASSNGADPVLTEITGALALVQQETPAYVAQAAANDPQNPNAGSDELAGLQQEEQNLTNQLNFTQQFDQAQAISNADTAQAAALQAQYNSAQKAI